MARFQVPGTGPKAGGMGIWLSKDLVLLMAFNLTLALAQFAMAAYFARLVAPQVFGTYAVAQGLSALVLLLFATGTFHLPSVSDWKMQKSRNRVLRLSVYAALTSSALTWPWALLWDQEPSLFLLISVILVSSLTPWYNFVGSVARNYLSTARYFMTQFFSMLVAVFASLCVALTISAEWSFFLFLPANLLVTAVSLRAQSARRAISESEANDEAPEPHLLSETELSRLMRILRWTAIVNYINGMPLRWAVSQAQPVAVLGQLNRAEGVSLGPISQLQSALAAIARHRGLRLIKSLNQQPSASIAAAKLHLNMLLAVTCLGIFAWVPLSKVVLLAFGSQYSVAADLAPPLLIAYLFGAVGNFVGFLMEVSRKPRAVLLAQIVNFFFSAVTFAVAAATKSLYPAIFFFILGSLAFNAFLYVSIRRSGLRVISGRNVSDSPIPQTFE